MLAYVLAFFIVQNLKAKNRAMTVRQFRLQNGLIALNEHFFRKTINIS